MPEDDSGKKGAMTCELCPHKVLFSEAQVEEHLKSKGHLRALKRHVKAQRPPEQIARLQRRSAAKKARYDAKLLAKREAKKALKKQEAEARRTPKPDARPEGTNGKHVDKDKGANGAKMGKLRKAKTDHQGLTVSEPPPEPTRADPAPKKRKHASVDEKAKQPERAGSKPTKTKKDTSGKLARGQ